MSNMEDQYIKWKWKYGDDYEQSSKTASVIKQENILYKELNKSGFESGLAPGLASGLESGLASGLASGLEFRENKRENSNIKLSQRDMMIRTSLNPYMTNNNYLDDLNVQEAYLKPKNSNYKEDR